MLVLGNVLAHWHEFFSLLGTAAGTLVALLFVAATVASGVFSSDRRAPLRIFRSPSIVHFSSVLVVSLILLAPVGSWTLLGVVVIGCGQSAARRCMGCRVADGNAAGYAV